MEQTVEFNSSDCIPDKERREQIPHDRISQLPDDITVSLLSHLSIKEAGATSVLSKRWLHVWKHINRFSFDASRTLYDIYVKLSKEPVDRDKNTSLLIMERTKYVKWVNQVLCSHMGSVIEEFSVCFDLNSHYKQEVDRWLRFALSRKVQRLELNLLMYNGRLRDPRSCYTFPGHLLTENIDFILWRSNSILGISRSHVPTAFQSLKVLIFKGVHVTNEVLQLFISSCPHLEHLAVDGSEKLENFEVSGPFLALKRLEIIYCVKMMSLKVFNTNLVSLEVLGLRVAVHIDNLPLLVEVTIGYSKLLGDPFATLSSCMSQLEVITLRVKNNVNWNLSSDILLPKLKRLVVCIDARSDQSLILCASLIKVAPYLEEFEFQLVSLEPSMVSKLNKLPTCPHRYLKKVKFVGYNGRKHSLELIRFFIKNALALEELFIDTRRSRYVCNFSEVIANNRDIEEEKPIKICAKHQLEGKLPSRVRMLGI